MKTIQKIIIGTFCTLVLISCTHNGMPSISDESTPEVVVQSTHKMFIGVPMLLSLEASYVTIGNGWALTAAHNKHIITLTGRKVIYHPYCDIALIRVSEDTTTVDLGKVYLRENIYASGYPVNFPLAYSKGEFIGDVILSGSPECVQSLSSFTVMSGMSGGGVWNDKEELVGTVVGILDEATMPDGTVYKDVSVWQPLFAVKDWIYKHTGMVLK